LEFLFERRVLSMSEATSVRKPVIDWLTVVAIAAIAISFNVVFHEGVSGLGASSCLGRGVVELRGQPRRQVRGPRRPSVPHLEGGTLSYVIENRSTSALGSVDALLESAHVTLDVLPS